MTILKVNQFVAPDPFGISLRSLAWVLADDKRANRFLGLTGLTPDQLRAGIGTREVQLAVLDFLCAHEPDLVAAADSLGLEPAAIASAREALAR
ncbi:MAG TPA: DUF3572 domain-containing protein [Croceibacterium sp.]|nr:DUF3572 domain-containing protein [Croceibacterium sp.]